MAPTKGKSRFAQASAESDHIALKPEQALAPGLYVTATPIGNAGDMTVRGLKVLANCDAIVAEDTRVTSRLLAIYGISRPLLIYNDHNAPGMRPRLLQKLREGARLALVSDAGTPLISDPGHRLVREAREANLPVFAAPGASAVLAALSVAGLPSDRFFFAGFLPVKSGERRNFLAALASVPATLIFFESARRLASSLVDMADILGAREGAVARELTKLHEEVRRGSLADLAADFAGAAPKGEIVILAGPPGEAEPPEARATDRLLERALAFMPVKEAATLVAEATGLGRREVYERALVLKQRGPVQNDA